MRMEAKARAVLWRQLSMAVAFGGGAAAGVIIGGLPGRAWQGFGVGSGLILAILWILSKAPVRRDPLDMFRGIRWPALLVALLAIGLNMGVHYAQLKAGTPLARSYAEFIPWAGQVVFGIGFGVWSLSWPRGDPHFGRQRWMGWFWLGFAAVMGGMPLMLVVVRRP